MINHARTLLANLSGVTSGYAGYPGEEYIPPAFRKLALGNLDSVYRVLFGSNPDPVFVNYRVRQLMHAVHSTELSDYVYALDSRVTYDTSPIDELFYDLFQTHINPGSGVTETLYLVGDSKPDTDQGRCYREWFIEVLTGTTVRVTRQTPPPSQQVYEFTTTDGLSSLVPLPGSELQIRFEPSVSASWRVVSYARPSRSLGDLERELQKIGEPLLVRLFRVTSVEGRQEPYLTFRNCWQRHTDQAYRLSGLLLAYIYRVEALRESQ